MLYLFIMFWSTLFNLAIIINSVIAQLSLPSNYSNPHFVANRSAIVQLFEWRFDDIANECVNFLAKHNYGGVQVSPVFEYAKITNPLRPWWERYQPVSYQINSRSGDVHSFTDMIVKCNNAGVRIYVDIVVNHMTGSLKGQGVAGSPFDGTIKSYPAVPYQAEHFNSRQKCGSNSGSIENSNDANQVRNCELLGLRDLDLGNNYVQQKIILAMNSLIKLGVAGFRIDASKHVWPNELKTIVEKLENLNVTYFKANSRPFLYHEVAYIDGDGPKPQEYLNIGSLLEFRYRHKLTDVFMKRNNEMLKWLNSFGEKWNLMPSKSAVPFVDNHDYQRSDPWTGINFRSPKLLKLATAFMLAWPYGTPKIMSSYEWPLDSAHPNVDNTSPPMESDESIKRVEFDSDLSCKHPWRCEHRWRQIYNMVRFRSFVANESVSNWITLSDNSIAFGRGSKGFVAMVNENRSIDQTLQTGLSAGNYCDIISGNLIVDKSNKRECSGKIIKVENNGTAKMIIDGSSDDDPMIAIYGDAKL